MSKVMDCEYLKKQLEETESRIDELIEFMDGKSYKDLHEYERELLYRQLSLMEEYRIVLRVRLIKDSDRSYQFFSKLCKLLSDFDVTISEGYEGGVCTKFGSDGNEYSTYVIDRNIISELFEEGLIN